MILLPFMALVGSISESESLAADSDAISYAVPVSSVARIIIGTTRGWHQYGPVAATAMAFATFSVSLNVMVTGLILFQLRRTCSEVSKAFPNAKRPHVYSNVAAIVIESAAPLTIFGICWVAVTGIIQYQKPVILSQRGTLNVLAEVSACLCSSFSVSSAPSASFQHQLVLIVSNCRHCHPRWSYTEFSKVNHGRALTRVPGSLKSFLRPSDLQHPTLPRQRTSKRRLRRQKTRSPTGRNGAREREAQEGGGAKHCRDVFEQIHDVVKTF